MGDNYGRLWTKEFGDTPTGENSWAWTVAIKDLSTRQVIQGIQNVIKQCLKYPPKPIQFRGLCLQGDAEEADRLYQEVINWKQLADKSREGLFIMRAIEDYSFFSTRANVSQAREIFDKAYAKLLQHKADGKELPEFPKQIEYEERPSLNQEQLSSYLGSALEGWGERA